MNELAKTYQASDGQEITLTPNGVARFILGGNAQNVPEQEYAKVIMTCAARGLNPLAGDVAIQPRWDKQRNCTSLQIVPTKDYFQRRAAMHPTYRGKKCGVVVLTQDGRPVKRQGCNVYQQLGETLLGGWCEVYVEGREFPEYEEVSFQEYSTGKALWATKPATMICKVAKSHALREAFPNEFQGLYEPEEMGIDTDADGNIVEPQGVAMVTDEGPIEVPAYVEDEPPLRDEYRAMAKEMGMYAEEAI